MEFVGEVLAETIGLNTSNYQVLKRPILTFRLAFSQFLLALIALSWLQEII